MSTDVLAPETRGWPRVSGARTILSWAWSDRAVAYGLPALVAGVAVALWFRPGAFVAMGDVPPFVRDNLRSELWSSWNHQLSGAGSASCDVGRLLDVILLRATELVGLPAMFAQQILYVLVAAAASCGVAYWARGFGVRAGAAALAGLVAVFNPYVLVNMPNPLPLLTIALAGAVGGILIRTGAGQRIGVVALVLVTLPVSYVSLNPPLVAMLLAWVGICLAVVAVTRGRSGLGRSLRLLALAAPVVVLAHLWWLVPSAQTLGGGGGVEVAAVRDINRWSWTQAENSLANVTTLRAFWGWPYPEYVPYARDLDAAPWAGLAWLLPAAAAVGVLLARGPHRRALWLLGLTAGVLLVVAKGIHPPFADLNRALYDVVPGFWLLREPMSKVGALLVPIYALLVAVAVDRAWLRPSVVWHWWRPVVVAGAVLALAYPWPLWTGDVVPASRGQFPGGHVVLPAGWERAAELVNRSAVEGKALVLPLDPQYQMLTTWGYQGIDVIPQQLFTRPVIQPLPDIYFGSPPGYVGLVKAVEDALLGGDTSGAAPLLDALGVSHVVVRRDLEPSPLLGVTADEHRLADGARRLPGWSPVGELPVAHVFERQSSAPVVRSADALTTVAEDGLASDPGLVASMVATISSDELVSTAPGPAGTRRSWAFPADQATTIVGLDQPGQYEVTSRLRSRSLHHVAVDNGEPLSAFVRSPLAAAFDDRPLVAPAEQVVPLTAPADAIDVGGTIVAVPGEVAATPVLAAPGDSVTLWGRPAPLAVAPLQPGDRCASTRRSGRGGRVEPAADGSVRVVGAPKDGTCAVALVPEPVSPAEVLRISFEHRNEKGAGAQVCIRETDSSGCADLPALLSDSQWRTYTGFLRPGAATAGLRVELGAVSGARAGERSIVGYRNVTVERLALVGGTPLPVQPQAGFAAELAAGPHILSVATAPAPAPLQFEGLEDCFAFDETPADEAGLKLQQDGDRIRLQARRHSACTTAVADPSLSSGLYRVTFDYRTLSGNRARVCLWQEGRQRCARMPELADGGSWTSYATYVRPDPGTSALRLYLYADGDGRRTTRTEYRRVAVTPVAPLLTTVTEAAAAGPTPEMTWDRVDPARYDVHVEGATGSLALGLSEAYVGGWRLEGLPEGWSARHLEVNGYANGWRIQGSGPADLRLVYRPARIARAAAWLSALTLGALALAFGLKKAGRWRGRPSPG